MLRSSKLLVAGAMFALWTTVAPTAQAQSVNQLPASCYPQFSNAQHVYVAAEVSGDATFPLDFSGLESSLKDVSDPHGLKVYFVTCTADFNPDKSRWVPGRDLVNSLAARWQGVSGFDNDKFLILTYVRQSNPDQGKAPRGSWGIVGGTYLQQQGFTKDYLGSANGPLARDLAQYRNNPKGEILKTVRYMNAEIDQKVADAQAERDRQAAEAKAQHDQQVESARRQHERDVADQQAARDRAQLQKEALIGGGLGLVGLLLLLGLGIQTIRYRSARSRAAALISKFETERDKLNTNWLALQDEHLDFLKTTGGTDWKAKFTGETLTDYTSAVTAFDAMGVSMGVLSQLIDDAKKAFKGGSFRSLSGFAKAESLLTTETIHVTGERKAAEKWTAFGTNTEDSEFVPTELLNGIDAKYQSCNTSCLNIRSSFDGAEKNAVTLTAKRKALEALRDVVVGEKKLSFAPYQARLDAIGTEHDQFAAIMKANPEKAFAESQKVAKDADGLEADLKLACTVVDSLAAVETSIATVVTRIAKVRGTDAGFKYPDGAAASTGNFLLNEAGSNPDGKLDEARKTLADALAVLNTGDAAKAVKTRDEAQAKAAQADALITASLAAKEHVEQTVPQVVAALAKLVAETPAADKSVTELRNDFLEKNYSGQAGNLKRAQDVSQATAAQLAQVKAAYLEQRFVAAKGQVDTVGHDVQSARDGLVAVNAVLKQLQGQRDHSRTAVKEVKLSGQTLKAKLHQKDFSTASVTADLIKALVPDDDTQDRGISTVGSLERAVAKPVADWPATAAAVDAMAGKLGELSDAVDNQERDYVRAKEKVAALSTAIDTAGTYTQRDETRQPARDKLQEAVRALATVQGQVQTAHSPWADIARRATDACPLAAAAQQQAQADKALHDDVSQSLRSVDREINDADGDYGQSIGQQVVPDLNLARGTLRDAKSAFSERRYEDAKRLVDEASRKSQAAVASAQQYVSDELQRRQRAAEEERERVAAVAAAAAAAVRQRELDAQRDRDQAAQPQRDQDAQRQRRDRDDDGGIVVNVPTSSWPTGNSAQPATPADVDNGTGVNDPPGDDGNGAGVNE